MEDASNTTDKFNVLQDKENSFFEMIKYFKYIYYVRMVLIIFGIPGNIMCIYVMRQNTFKTMARSYICITLAVADLGYLLLETLRGIFFVHNGLEN